jgi:hypothetical protein
VTGLWLRYSNNGGQFGSFKKDRSRIGACRTTTIKFSYGEGAKCTEKVKKHDSFTSRQTTTRE